MKKNSRFDCLKDNEPKKVKSAPKHVSKSAPRPAPRPTHEPAPAPTHEPAPAPAHALAPTHEPTPAPALAPTHEPAPAPPSFAPTHEPAPAPALAPTHEPAPAPTPKTNSWKDLIIETKNKDNDILKPKRGYVIMYKNKNTIERIVHPLDIQEDLIRRQIAEEHRQQEHYEELRARSINYFEYDLMVGNRDDFNSVEEYIEYLDKPLEDSDGEEDEEEEFDEEEYEDEEEYN
jgi:hypothetical protein